MTVIYATANDYATWTGGAAPANITALLRSASLLIAEETISAYYDVDTNGAPTNSVAIAAFRDATCAQASVWAGLGVNPTLGGLDATAPKRSKGIGTARIDYDTSATGSAAAFAARQAATTGLCVEAARILQQAGLLGNRAWTYG